MADQSNARSNVHLTSSMEELVNNVLSHPNFRNVVDNISSRQTGNQGNNRPSTSSQSLQSDCHSGRPSTSSQPLLSDCHSGPAEELRNLFNRGNSLSQQQNFNATIPRFNNRFTYQPKARGRSRPAPYVQCNQKGKSKGKASSTCTGQPLCREVVLLNNPDDNKVVRGSRKVSLHKAGNVISAFKFEKHWRYSRVYEELLKEFSQLESVKKTPK